MGTQQSMKTTLTRTLHVPFHSQPYIVPTDLGNRDTILHLRQKHRIQIGVLLLRRESTLTRHTQT